MCSVLPLAVCATFFSAARNNFLALDLFRVGTEESLQPATPVTVNLYPLAMDIGLSMLSSLTADSFS